MNDRQVLQLRGPKAVLDERRAYAAVWEEEPDATGALVPTAVLFLTNRECPFRCVMCDLWVNTLDSVVAPGSIPAQIHGALAGLPAARQVKLYNAGSYFDPSAIPPEDDEAIASLLGGYDRVIVESHPAFMAGAYGERCLRLRDLLAGPQSSTGPADARRAGRELSTRLEIAIGLETAHEPTLARLNKRMTVETFRRAADFVVSNGMALRVFVLLNPPFMPGAEAEEWACRSIDVAADCGAEVCSILPTRDVSAIMPAPGPYERPRLSSLERVVAYGLRRGDIRVFADLWDVEKCFDCACSRARAARLRDMNRSQAVAAPVLCGCTSHGERGIVVSP